MGKQTKTITLSFIWRLRCSLRAEGDKLWAEGDKLRAEGDKLWAEGAKLWAEAILEVHGNITLIWHSDTDCELATGERFTDANE